jgi:hypothetical protein
VLGSTLSAAGASLLVETTQATGVFGLIGCAYRLGDVDDLLTNTLGGLLGALVAPVVLGWMPRPGDLAAGRSLPRPVTVTRRWAGMLVDAALVTFVGYGITVGYRLLLLATGRPLPGDGDAVELLIGTVLPVAALLWLPPLLGSGASLGQRARTMDSRDNYPDRDRPQPPDYRRLPEGAPTEQFGYRQPYQGQQYQEPAYQQPEPPQKPRRNSTGVWISVILLLAALIALLFFILWLNNRDDDSSGTTVTRTVEETTPEQTTPAPEPDEGNDNGSDPGVQIPSELPSQEDLEDWGNQLGDDFDDFLNDLENRFGN